MPAPGHIFDLERVDTERLRRIGDKLRAIGYSERGVRKRLGLSRLSDLRLESYPYYLIHRLARREPIDIAIALFLLQDVIAVEELERLFDREEREVLKGLGVLLGEKASRTYRASVSLYPQRDMIIATDHRFAHEPWIAARKPHDPVAFMDENAHYLMRATIRRPVRAALDLCAGAGFQALYEGTFAERVVGLDVSPRAVNFARLNAILNNSWNVTFLESDLFDAVRGERFDYIAATPPSAASPGYELRSRDGGPSGADVLRRVIASLPDMLAAGGYAQVATLVAEREGEAYLERIRRWLTGANMNMHALRIQELSLEEYAVSQVHRPFEQSYSSYVADLRRWVENLRVQHFKRVLRVLLTFEWNDDRASPPWTQEDEVKPPRRSIGDDLLQLFKARHWTRRPSAAAELDRCLVSVPDDIILARRSAPSGTGLVPKDYRITWKDPALSPELEIKPLVCELLELIDNRRSVPEIIAAYAKKNGLPVEAIDKKARQAFLAMYERALITLDKASGDAPQADLRDSSADLADELLDPEALPDLDAMLADANVDAIGFPPPAPKSPLPDLNPRHPSASNPSIPIPFNLSAPSGYLPAPSAALAAGGDVSPPAFGVGHPPGASRPPADGVKHGSGSLGAMAALARAAEEEIRRAPDSGAIRDPGDASEESRRRSTGF